MVCFFSYAEHGIKLVVQVHYGGVHREWNLKEGGGEILVRGTRITSSFKRLGECAKQHKPYKVERYRKK